MDASELKQIWQDAVRRLLQSDTYKVSKSFDSIFEKVAHQLYYSNAGVDPVRFVEVQIKYMIEHNMLDKLFPNVLSGEGALKRYLEAPSPSVERELLLKSLQSQAKCFESVCRNMGEEFAFSGTVNDFNPAFLAFMLWTTKREIPEDLKRNAKAEFDYKPLLASFFPPDYVRHIKP